MPGKTSRVCWIAAGKSHRALVLSASVALLVVLLGCSTAVGGVLDDVRDEVRSPSGGSSRSSSHDDDHHHHHCDDDDDDTFLGSLLGGIIEGMLSSSSTSDYSSDTSTVYEAPNDDPPVEFYFPRFPYDSVPGYMTTSSWDPLLGWTSTVIEDPTVVSRSDPLGRGFAPSRGRRWAGRFRAEYADTFDDLTRLSGHLLVSTTAGLGLDTGMDLLQENLPGTATDQLWLGDCNVIYRYSESAQTQWRFGFGFNWLNDPIDTDFGFNFTLGMDYYPAQPWIISSTIDWGTVGSAELFRFRITSGVIVYGLEPYIGYEYLDVDSMQINNLIAGVRVWF
ncbi:MAG: hypothetical protein HQ567_20130 [Candidatus Nealsonbacteria bacterium]|nr:hypothetical protein [Candidatus Nealsonbacteria bacterium]